MTKLFSPREVILRIQAMLWRGDGKQDGERLSAGPIVIDPARHQVLVDGKRVHLTSIEFKLLRTLVQRRGRVQERDRLLNEVWGYESVIDTRTVDTMCGGYANRLAEKFSYRNTYYHQEPRLDILAAEIATDLMVNDFIISSEVFEHVVPPVTWVFENVWKMLKPGALHSHCSVWEQQRNNRTLPGPL